MTPYIAEPSAPDAWQASRFDAVLIAAPSAGQDATDAITLAGGRLVTRIAWDEVETRLDRLACTPLLCIEATGMDQDMLLAMLPRIDAMASAMDLCAIVALDAERIDVVAANLLHGQVQLLCAPTLSERTVALAIAADSAVAVTLHDRVREGEAARLEHLNAEVARIAEVLARLTRKEERPPAGAADFRRDFAIESIAADPAIDAHDIRAAIRTRRLRDQFFGARMFEDPAWDMLLDLFAAHLDHSRVSVSSLCIAAAVAPTTALRWIARMTEAGLFERQPDPLDRRRAYMVLSEKALAGMRGYVATARRQGLGIA